MVKFIVKLAPEITIKTRPVRKRFIARLHANLGKIFLQRKLPADISHGWDMLEIMLVQKQRDSVASFSERRNQVVDVLRHTPGIAHFLEVEERHLDLALDASQLIEGIAEQACSLLGDQLLNKTFVVRCKRSNKNNSEHCFTSHDVEREVGAYLLENASPKGVSLREPEFTVGLEIKGDRLFIIKLRTEGLGGYPLGCVGQVLSLISGGYDSSVASYDMMKRGMETHFCFFNLGGHAHEIGVKQVSHYLWENYASSHRTAFISVPFGHVVEEILLNVANPYMGVVLKRMMMRAASQIANEMGITALVTGESVAQVSSQTIQNLSVIDKVTELLTMRPLIAADKTDIIARAVNIGVADYAANMPEYCAVISDKPTAAAKLSRVEAEEQNIDFTVLDKAVNARVLCGIDSVYDKEQVYEEIEKQSVPNPEQIVIDLRHDDEREKRPLILHANKTLNIPFYKINTLFTELDPTQQYLLYCDRGVMSKIHAAHLMAEGFTNVKIYHP